MPRKPRATKSFWKKWPEYDLPLSIFWFLCFASLAYASAKGHGYDLWLVVYVLLALDSVRCAIRDVREIIRQFRETKALANTSEEK
jgi:hypothetical protein